MNIDLETIKPLLEDLSPTLLSYAVRTLGVLFALWVAFKIASALERRLTATVVKRGVDQTLAGFMGNLVRWMIVVAAVLSCLSVFGIETTSFAAVLGAAGLAIGLAFQGTLSNFSAGVMIVTFRPFKIGDFVVAGGHKGTIADVGLFTSSLDTADNRRIIVPNSAVMGGAIENFNHHATRRVDISVGVSYSANLQLVREVLEKVAAGIQGRDPKLGHQVILLGLGGSSIDWQVRVWCASGEYWNVWDATVLAVKEGLDAAGIEIPFPQMDVHFDTPPTR